MADEKLSLNNIEAAAAEEDPLKALANKLKSLEIN